MELREFDRRTTGDREATLMARLGALRAGGPLDEEALDREVMALMPFPAKIQLQTTTRCNAACEMCPYPVVTSEEGFLHQEMSEQRFAGILAQLEGRPVERLSLFLMNEPLLDKRLPGWVARARERLPSVTLGLFTNGSTLNADAARRLAGAGLDELCVSVHGFDPATYQQVMRGLSYDRLERNLRQVLALAARGDLAGMHVHVIAGDVVQVRASLERAHELIRERTLLKAFSNERRIVGAQAGAPSLPAPQAGPLPALCHRPFVKLYVLADGRCVLCNCDWRATVVLGRTGGAGDMTVEQVWRSGRYRAVRHQLLTARCERGSLCEGCDYAAVVGNG